MRRQREDELDFVRGNYRSSGSNSIAEAHGQEGKLACDIVRVEEAFGQSARVPEV